MVKNCSIDCPGPGLKFLSGRGNSFPTLTIDGILIGWFEPRPLPPYGAPLLVRQTVHARIKWRYNWFRLLIVVIIGGCDYCSHHGYGCEYSRNVIGGSLFVMWVSLFRVNAGMRGQARAACFRLSHLVPYLCMREISRNRSSGYCFRESSFSATLLLDIQSPGESSAYSEACDGRSDPIAVVVE